MPTIKGRINHSLGLMKLPKFELVFQIYFPTENTSFGAMYTIYYESPSQFQLNPSINVITMINCILDGLSKTSEITCNC